MYDFITINENQFGFVKNEKTRVDLDFIAKIIYEKLNESKPTAISFPDIVKAFKTNIIME